LPLSIPDYVARFSLELVVLLIATSAFVVNFSVNNHAISSSDQSVIFSFLQENPKLNSQLLASIDTTTILTQSDQLINKALAQSNSVVLAASTNAFTPINNPTTIQADVIVKTNPADTQAADRIGLTKYTVAAGDTIESIAQSFGISPQTIMMENNINESTNLKPGMELTILPTTGITYTIKDGDTLNSIISKYKISEEDFLDINNIESFDDLEVGAVVIIPLQSVTVPTKPNQPKPASNFTKSEAGKVDLKTAKAPSDLASSPIDFMWPTPVKNITQGFSSRHTGIDISNSQKEPIYAAADGFVEISGFQTNGYGNTIVINHGNGYKTRYGHASELYVTAGQYVKKGQLIAKQGNTGRVRGVTGIHLHFEIIKNGVRVNPLNYVSP
jgi:murein DD-endopeptidase MepM/ murein hydrolase activator NlpD